MPVRLVPIASGKSIKLDKPVLLIGRNPDCDVILTRSRKVSRTHCIVACVENSVRVRDLGSTNGVWVNGHRVERESRVRVGDELSIADVRYQLLNVEREGRNGTSAEIPAYVDPQPEQDRDRRDDKGRKRHREKDRRKSDRRKRREHLAAEERAGVERVGDNHEERLRNAGLRPLDLSQNYPVPIPEEDDSFVIEASMPRLPKPSSLEKLDEVAEEDGSWQHSPPSGHKEEPRSRRRSRKYDPEDSSCDVIPLEDQGDQGLDVEDQAIDAPPSGNLLDQSTEGAEFDPIDIETPRVSGEQALEMARDSVGGLETDPESKMIIPRYDDQTGQSEEWEGDSEELPNESSGEVAAVDSDMVIPLDQDSGLHSADIE